MKGRRWPRLFLIAALLGTYGYRCVEGIRAGWLFDRGHLYRNLYNYEESAPRLESAAVGANRLRALMMAGEARLNLFERQVRTRGALGADANELIQAAEDYLLCRCAAPTARLAWNGLGETYDAVEWIGREGRARTPYTPPASAWARVGRAGRVSVGLHRIATEISPNWFLPYNRLALTLWNYGLDDPARAAVRASARVLPVYARHAYPWVTYLPDWVPEEFALASHEALGEAPLFPRSGHLLDLGKLERRIGANDRAIPLLREVLAMGGDELRRAEASFHLGLALIAEGEYEEGRTLLEAAKEHPAFRVDALRSLAKAAEDRGELDVALGHLRLLRREKPDELEPCLRFAEVAQRLGERSTVLESLRWAKLKHPDDPRPYVALAEAHLSAGETADATTVADALENLLGADAPEVVGLRRRIAEAARAAIQGNR